MLERYGYRVTMTTSSTDALQRFSTDPAGFDLLITDQTMPEMSGAELAAALKKIRPEIPVILCTGYSSKIKEKQITELDIQAFCMKPFDMRQLLLLVRKILDKSEDREYRERKNY